MHGSRSSPTAHVRRPETAGGVKAPRPTRRARRRVMWGVSLSPANLSPTAPAVTAVSTHAGAEQRRLVQVARAGLGAASEACVGSVAAQYPGADPPRPRPGPVAPAWVSKPPPLIPNSTRTISIFFLILSWSTYYAVNAYLMHKVKQQWNFNRWRGVDRSQRRIC